MPRSALVVVVLACACSSSVVEPPRAAHSPRAFNEVPYPPPGALVETVPPRPDNAYWIDGEWVFRGRFYVWQRGGWVQRVPGARFAKWRTEYLADGRLLLANGRWYDAKGRRMEPPKVLVEATTPPNEITSEFQAPR